MEEKDYTVEGRKFFSERDYARARRDKEIIDGLRRETDFRDRRELERLRRELREEKYRFLTILGRDFREEVEELLKKADALESGRKGKSPGRKGRTKEPRKKEAASARHKAAGIGGTASAQRKAAGNKEAGAVRQEAAGKRQAAENGGVPRETGGKNQAAEPAKRNPAMDRLVASELKKREKRRKLIIAVCSMMALCCLGYFGLYSYYDYRTEQNYRRMSMLKENAVNAGRTPTAAPASTPPPPLYTLDEEQEPREVLEEYKNLLITNKKLIGWLKIDDTNIDYPVMQTTDNEYYLNHNTEQEYDINGAIFMDKDCDVLKPSTNYILYGHHMVNGKMFGKLYLYQKESYFKEHQYISFDTIYEKGTYQVMYVFPAKVYKETDIVFKYYQFIDANSAQEFDSYMQEMADMSLYDTGVTAQYGDQLLTLSTCDNQSTNGRFVVVAKKIAKE